MNYGCDQFGTQRYYINLVINIFMPVKFLLRIVHKLQLNSLDMTSIMS